MMDGIKILKQVPEGACGGTNATLDTNAPKTILSDEVLVFHATSMLPFPGPAARSAEDRIGYISAFAAPADAGWFLYLETSDGRDYHSERSAGWALVKADPSRSLATLAKDCRLAEQNGYHSRTNGLPKDFGGSVDIRFAGGEEISFSDNQSPVLPRDAGLSIVSLFRRIMSGERVRLPGVADLREIRFQEDRGEDGFTSVTLTLLPDGTGQNRKTSRYGLSEIFENCTNVDAETISHIRTGIDRCGILGWAGLPKSGFRPLHDKKLVFVFDNGNEISVPDGLSLPWELSGGFFSIELEITT